MTCKFKIGDRVKANACGLSEGVVDRRIYTVNAINKYDPTIISLNKADIFWQYAKWYTLAGTPFQIALAKIAENIDV